VIGITASTESILSLSGSGGGWKGLALGLVLATSGLLLLIGLRTTLASAAFACVKFAILASWVGRPAANTIGSPWETLYGLTIAIAVALLGPGSISMDSRLLGPREIIIPSDERCG
jgi:uncharacterized membrane protein YphA (DoxX/SURF4 family)